MKPLIVSTAAVLTLAALFAGTGKISTGARWRTSHFENVLGTSMEIKLIAATDASADRAEAAALGEIKRLNGILSGYDAASEFSRWAKTRDQAVHVSPELMEVLKLWDSWRTRSNGALNPAAAAVIDVWKRAEKTGRMPEEDGLLAAANAAGMPQWKLDERTGTATRLTATPIILNSFTKSYIVERAAEAALQTPGVSAAVVNIGGDLVVRGSASDTVNVTDPRADAENGDPVATLQVGDRAVATSGSYRRGFEIGGQHFSHIVDPRSGRTADSIIGATVGAPNAVDAGALATALCVLSPEEGGKLVATVPGAEYMLIAQNGTRYASAGWNALQSQLPLLTPGMAQSQTAAGHWNPGYELIVNVELPQPQGFGARRPYVAIWVEDKDHYPVRTLSVLYEKPRWLNELRAWYRDDKLRAMSEGNDILSSVTSATRSPGKYSFKWDGKDNSGKLVKEGRYTVLVEAAREHGGYNLVKRELNFAGEPAQDQAAASGELGAVTIEYRKVAR
jgi:thiamine biosynthesis lipoprotein ApbE